MRRRRCSYWSARTIVSSPNSKYRLCISESKYGCSLRQLWQSFSFPTFASFDHAEDWPIGGYETATLEVFSVKTCCTVVCEENLQVFALHPLDPLGQHSRPSILSEAIATKPATARSLRLWLKQYNANRPGRSKMESSGEGLHQKWPERSRVQQRNRMFHCDSSLGKDCPSSGVASARTKNLRPHGPVLLFTILFHLPNLIRSYPIWVMIFQILLR